MVPKGEPSFPHPLGVSLVDGGANVALYSSVAEAVSFSTFDGVGTETSHPLMALITELSTAAAERSAQLRAR